MAFDTKGNFYYDFNPEKGIIPPEAQICAHCSRYLPWTRLCRYQIAPPNGQNTDPVSTCISRAASGEMAFLPTDSVEVSLLWRDREPALTPDRI